MRSSDGVDAGILDGCAQRIGEEKPKRRRDEFEIVRDGNDLCSIAAVRCRLNFSILEFCKFIQCSVAARASSFVPRSDLSW